MADTSEERRRFTRINFGAAVNIEQGENHFTTQLVDISLNGVLVDTPHNYALHTDTPIDILIMLSDDTHISMRATLAHSSSAVLGFKCDSIDMESIAHLRRIIELNIDDPHASERVLSELLHRENN